MNENQREELKTRFTFHPATEVTGPIFDKIRDECGLLATWLMDITPECREQSLAITHLEEVMFWANAAVARRKP